MLRAILVNLVMNLYIFEDILRIFLSLKIVYYNVVNSRGWNSVEFPELGNVTVTAQNGEVLLLPTKY